MTEEELVQQVLQRARAESEQRSVTRETRPWLYAFIGLCATLLVGMFLMPGTFAERLELVVHGVCAQQHHIIIGETTMPLCARNTGIYSGFLATLIFLLALGRKRAALLPPRSILITLVVFIGVMAIDGFNSLFLDLGLPHPYTPRNDLRTITGLLMGTSVGTLILYAFNNSIWAQREAAPVLRSWAELAGALLFSGLLFALLYAGPLWMALPLAIWSVVGIVGVLFMANILVIAVMMRSDLTTTRLVQLAKPASIALLLTAGELAALAWARHMVESQVGIV